MTMLSVTSPAKERLREDLQKKIRDPETFIRIVSSPSDPAGIELTVDTEREGDKAIKDNAGQKLLLIGRDLDPVLSDMVLDIGDEELQFTITRS
jgi:hypothetical protein